MPNVRLQLDHKLGFLLASNSISDFFFLFGVRFLFLFLLIYIYSFFQRLGPMPFWHCTCAGTYNFFRLVIRMHFLSQLQLPIIFFQL